MSTRAFQFLRDLAHEREEEVIETTPLFARKGDREFGTPRPLRQHMLRTTSHEDELEGEALELAPLFSRTDLREFEKSPTFQLQLGSQARGMPSPMPKSTRKSLRSFEVECQFWSTPWSVQGAPGPLSDGNVGIRIQIWDGRGNRRRLFPAKDVQSVYLNSSSVNGLTVPGPLSGIQSNEIKIMAGVRFGGRGGQEHYIVGVFPLPESDPFQLTAYVEFTTTTIVVRARDSDAALPKAQAKLVRETKISKAMLGEGPMLGFTAGNRPGSFEFFLPYYSGKMWFDDPKPTALLGKR